MLKFTLSAKKFGLAFGLFLCFGLSSFAQTGAVRGVITEEGGKEPLIGATVLIKGTTIGAATSSDGSYIITTAPVGAQTLVVSYLGFDTFEVPVNIAEGQTLTQNAELSSSSKSIDEIVITGLRRSQLTSINSKRMASNQKDVLSTDDLGRLPDINVAEATQRIAGVSIETDAGEGRFISIRGIQPSLVNVSMNGSNLASSSGGRETPLNLLPIEMIGSIEVMKTVTPDMEATSIGGSVNINTISAFDRLKPQFLVVSVDGLYTDQQVDFGDQGLQSRLAITAGKRFGAKENFGVVLAANYFARSFAQVILDPDRWQILQGTDAQGNLTPGYLGPNEIEIQYEDNKRVRYGLNADLEYRPTDNSKYYFRALYTREDETDYNNEFELTVAGISGQTLTNQTPTSGTFSRGSGELDLSSNDFINDLYSFNLGTEQRMGKFFLTLNGVYSRADQNQFGIDGTFENDAATNDLLGATYNTAPFFFDIIPTDLETASNTSIYFLRNLNIRENNIVREDMYEGSFDLKYNFNLTDKIPAYLKVGGRVRSREKQVDRSRNEYNDDSEEGVRASDRYRLDEFDIAPPAVPVGNTQPYVSGDPRLFRDFFANPSNLNNTERIFFRQDDTDDEIFDEDINYRETVSAGYIMGVIDTKFIQIVGGVRVEHTELVSSPYVDSGEGFEPLDFKNSYTNILPNLNLTFNITPSFVARAAWTNTLGRAQYSQLAGTSELEISDDNEDGSVTGSFEGANADLKPYISQNLDLSLEYYFKSGGLLSGGLFYKDIDNQIFQNRYTQNNITFAGQFFDELSFSQFVNLNTATLLGVEGSYDQSFSFLKGFWSGFGITANFAYITSDAQYPNREDESLRLLRQPKLTYNIIPYFQYKGWEVRVAITHRGDFLVAPRSTENGFVEDALEINPSLTEADFDLYEDSRTVLDITAAYTFPSSKVKILAQARNLNNAPEQQYSGSKSRYDRYRAFGAAYFLGVSINL